MAIAKDKGYVIPKARLSELFSQHALSVFPATATSAERPRPGLSARAVRPQVFLALFPERGSREGVLPHRAPLLRLSLPCFLCHIASAGVLCRSTLPSVLLPWLLGLVPLPSAFLPASSALSLLPWPPAPSPRFTARGSSPLRDETCYRPFPRIKPLHWSAMHDPSAQGLLAQDSIASPSHPHGVRDSLAKGVSFVSSRWQNLVSYTSHGAPRCDT